MPDDLDLTAELDAAEDIVMGRAETVVTEWGMHVPYKRPYVAPCRDEQEARRVAATDLGRELGYTVVRRTVTYGPWEEEVPE
jgi:hypothetical protein